MMKRLHQAREALTASGGPFEIQHEQIRGVPTRVWKNAPASLRAVFERMGEHGDHPYLVCEDDRLTYAEHYARTAALAAVLVQRFGVARGDRVAIAMRNCPEFVTSFWATVSIGAVAVPLNGWWSGAELAFALADCRARVLIADAERLERLAPHRGDLDIGGVLVVGDSTDGAVSYAELLQNVPADSELPSAEIASDDLATILYTSGTTGRPKGALGTHRNICSTIWNVAFVLAWSRVVKGGSAVDATAQRKTILVTVPMFHVMGCFSALATHSFAGSKVVLMRRWNAEHALDLVEKEGITHVGGVPAVMRQLADTQRTAPRDVSSLERFNYGGAPAPPELLQALHDVFPDAEPACGYGMTETSSPVSIVFDDYLRRRPTSVGPPFPVCECRVVNGTGEDVHVGETGELWVRGPNVVAGYWERPEATAETLGDGWLRTGDVASMDEHGFIYIVDRLKDMVIRGGENVYCIEVENALFEHPDVIESAVIGLPHEVLGEEVAAVVQVRHGATLTEASLQSHVAERLARFKVPVRIDIRHGELPRNAVGKVMKAVLRDELSG